MTVQIGQFNVSQNCTYWQLQCDFITVFFNMGCSLLFLHLAYDMAKSLLNLFNIILRLA